MPPVEDPDQDPVEDPADIPGPEKLPVPSLVKLLTSMTDPDFAEVFDDFDSDDFSSDEWQLRTQEMISFYGLEIANQFMAMMAVVWGALGSISEEQLAAAGATSGLEIDVASLGPGLITFVAGDEGAEIWEIGGVAGAFIATTYIAFKAFQVIQSTIGMAGTGVTVTKSPTFRPGSTIFNPDTEPDEVQEIVDEIAEIGAGVINEDFIEEVLELAENDQVGEAEALVDLYLGVGSPSSSPGDEDVD